MPSLTTLPMLQRQRLVWLGDAAWCEVLAQHDWDAQARACLTHWQRHQLPLVVARQPKGLADLQASNATIHLGLPMPNQWGRGRLSIAVPYAAVRAWGEFPVAEAIESLLPASLQTSWQPVCMQWQATDCQALVYGGYGWQALSGLAYLRPTSDLDILWPVQSADHADRIVQTLVAYTPSEPVPRIDGELLFPDHTAVNWREWQQWRSGQAQAILVKHIAAVQLCHQPWWSPDTSSPNAAHAHLNPQPRPSHARA